jgi:hypothetical protein
MNRFQKIALALASVGSIAAAPLANASPISPNPDVIDPTNITLTVGSTPTCPNEFTCGTNFISYVHDITDNGFTLGDTINSATLNIFLTDPGGSEVVKITVSLGQTAQTQTDLNIGSTATETLVLSAPSIADLQADGLLDVRVEVQQNGGPVSSFVFDRSELSVDFTVADAVVDADVNVSAVPVPGTLALFGLGFAGLGWSRRRK